MKTEAEMPLEIGNYLADTMGFTNAELGSYTLLIVAYWANAGPLPNDDKYLRTTARCPVTEWPRTKELLQQKFQVSNGTWSHKRIDAEIAKSQKRKEALSKASALGVEARRALGQIPTTSGQPMVSPSVLRISQEKELERVVQRIKEILAMGTQVAGAKMTYTTPQRAELQALKDRREQLKKGLGFIACLILLLATTLHAGTITNPPTRIAFAWEASSSTNAITNYAIYWGPAPAVYTNWVNVGTNLTGVVSNLDRGPIYYFAATCQDTNGLESLFSNEVATNLPAPPAPPANLRFQ